MTSNKKIRLFILQNMKVNASLLGLILAHSGYFDTVIPFENTEQAISELKTNPLDGSWRTIILLDGNQPEIGAEEFVKTFMQLLSSEKGNFQFVILTQEASPEQWVTDRKFPHIQMSKLNREDLFKAMDIELEKK